MIKANDKRVLEAIDELLTENVSPITYTLIQHRSLVSIRTVVRAVERLTRTNYLAVEREKLGMPYTYTILKRPETSNNNGM